MSMFGDAYNNMADWITSAWNGLPWTEKREDAAIQENKSEPLLQLAAIILVAGFAIHIVKKL